MQCNVIAINTYKTDHALEARSPYYKIAYFDLPLLVVFMPAGRRIRKLRILTLHCDPIPRESTTNGDAANAFVSMKGRFC